MPIYLGLFRELLTLLFHYFSDYNGVYDYDYSDRYCTEKVFIGISLFLVTTEFIVALTSAIFTCLFACCGGSGCCENSQRGNEISSI